MPRESKPTRRFGVFATIRGWLLADDVSGETFATRGDAVATARRLAHVARWRGARAEVVAQDRPGGALKVIDPPDRLEPD
ncbi:MAG TPA: hypothetical protein VN814_01535 [Caulobacteraceae bacterium]|nr:hypothetical protein [Caulobacteraceae bacterium]